MKQADLIRKFDLQPHPEGGFFRETYRAEGVIPDVPRPFAGGPRAYSTAIYFLLPRGAKSRFHRIASDEAWHFYLGGPMTLIELHPDGRVETIVLGQDLAAGQRVQHVVPAGVWFAGFPDPGTEYAFVGCTVAPGFDFADFQLAERAALLEQFPQAEDWILKLTD